MVGKTVNKIGNIFYLALMLLAWAIIGNAQANNPSIISVTTAPSGTCSAGLPNQQVTSTGTQYSCQNVSSGVGTWGIVGSSGGTITPGTQYQIPAYNAAGTGIQGTNITTGATGNDLSIPGTTAVNTISGIAGGAVNANNTWVFNTGLITGSGVQADFLGNVIVDVSGTAISGTNFSSRSLSLNGSYCTGTSPCAPATDQYLCQNTVGTGVNPSTTFTCTHNTGSSGAHGYSFDADVKSPSIGATTPGTGAFTSLTSNGSTVALAAVSAAITSATAGSGISAVTCTTTACTNLRGTYTMTATAVSAGATILTLVWPTTTTAYVCLVSQDGGTLAIAPSHSVATATGMTIASDLAITSGSVGIDYSCQP